MGGETGDGKIAADFVHVAGREADECVRRRLALDVAPAAEHRVNRAFQFAREKDGAGLHALERSLGEVVWKSGDMVHMPVRKADDVAGECEIRTPADVEADVQLWNLHEG